MRFPITIIITAGLIGLLAFSIGSSCKPADVARPEEIRSMRLVCYDTETYAQLADSWEKYLKAYPSEFAYSNWVYATRYARKDFIPQAKEGLKKYPSNPVLLYLASMEAHGTANDSAGRAYLERAVSIDPNYIDPWFSLVTIYMSANEDEKTDQALQRILESGYIHDEIMDFNYNVLIGLEPNSILITNGDNDTYPSWVLQRILKVRPDVTVANISLLNSEWYPEYLIAHGAPQFTTPEITAQIREQANREMAGIKDGNYPMNPFAKPLIVRLIEQATTDKRPVYFALTVYDDEFIKRYRDQGRLIGVATMITPTERIYTDQLSEAAGTWLNQYRVGGLDSWRLQSAREDDSGKRMVMNYAYVIAKTAAELRAAKPEARAPLFQWYLKHADIHLTPDMRKGICQMWLEQSDVPEIASWCEQQGCRQ